MNPSNARTQSVYRVWDLLMGLANDAKMSREVRREASWLLRHYPYARNANLVVPLRPGMGEQGEVTTRPER
jgi:hypothetical protein